ncbi:MAG: hypothetical protein KIT31_12045 [Deltaproteobacteria bacterium]|nr:hypothetical protein [Deltaproteobacteria bacterium]
MSDAEEEEPRPFSLTRGGPFYRLQMRLHLRAPNSLRRAWWIAVAAWVPIVLGAGVRHVLGMPADQTLHDLSIHVRLLVTLPVLLSSEIVLENSAASAIRSMYLGHFCDAAKLDGIAERAEWWRDRWWVEAGLLGIAILGGQLAMWGVFGAGGLFHGSTIVGVWSFPYLWYACIALPIVQFVMLRWVWRWMIWSYVLVRISRLPLTPLATHADGAAGLEPLARPVSAFSAFTLAISAIIAAAWGTTLLHEHTTIETLLPQLVIFLLDVLAIAVAPLLLFSGHLFRTRRRTLAQYGEFVRNYTLRFHAKWIDPPSPDDPLGSPDIQSLNDLGSAFQVVSKTRPFVFGPRTVFMVWFAGLIPMVPLFASTVTVESVLERIVKTVLGGFPF